MQNIIYAPDQTGSFIRTTFSAAFPFLGEGGHVVSLVGAGGKTTLMYQMADYCASLGQKVLVSTTTHIRMPLDGSFAADLEQARRRWRDKSYAVVGQPCANEKLCMFPKEELSIYLTQADIVFLEADGSKEHPMKVPAQKEPVLLKESDIVLAVCGLSALWRPLSDVCFRIDEAEALLKKARTEPAALEDVVQILTDELGARKNVGSREYYMILNQCDDSARLAAAKHISSAIRKKGYTRIYAACLKSAGTKEGGFHAGTDTL
jgi:probable selenium-dependent hydroxylase accessory protein YqeC